MGSKAPPYYSEARVAILNELKKAAVTKDFEMVTACVEKLLSYESNK